MIRNPHKTSLNGHFSDGDLQRGLAPTVVPAAVMNALQEEIASVIELEGFPLNSASSRQLYDAIIKIATRHAEGVRQHVNQALPDLIANAVNPLVGRIEVLERRSPVPAGMIAFWGDNAAPPGWYFPGDAFDRASNPVLSGLFPDGHIPDVRGLFVRILARGSASDPDSGRALWSIQQDALQEFEGTFLVDDQTVDFYPPTGAVRQVSQQGRYDAVSKHRDEDSRILGVNPRYAGARTSTETRSRNVALNLIIKGG